jgi:hypothetical protein
LTFGLIFYKNPDLFSVSYIKQITNNKNQKTMPKRSRSPESRKPIALSMFERWNVDTFNEICELVLPPDVESVLDRIKQEINKKTTRRRVDYRKGDFDEGRLYATGYQSISSWIRRLCAYQFYSEVDLVNCGPVLFVHVLREHNVEVGCLLAMYADDRMSVCALVQHDHPNSTDKDVKKMLLSALHGGDVGGKTLDQLKSETRECAKQLRKVSPKYSEMWKQCTKSSDRNPTGRFVSRVWQEQENVVVKTLKYFFESMKRINVGAIIFDCLMIEQLKDVDIESAEQYVLEEIGVKIRLACKSLEPTQSDKDRLYGEKSLHKLKTDQAKQRYLLVRYAHKDSLKRRDGFIMQRHPTIPGVFVRGMCDADYINLVLMGTHAGQLRNMTQLIDWFNTVDHPVFEIVTPDKINNNVISFQNGFFDIQHMTFTLWVDFNSTPPFTDHHFDCAFDVDEILSRSTPMWDNLLTVQLGPRQSSNHERSLVEMLEVMIGRCFYPVGTHDGWQTAIFLKGDGNTGKSTVLDLIRGMFPPSSVGAITSSFEPHFGLENLYRKRIVMVPDMPKQFSKVLSQSDFQSICSGDNVSIARKNKMALCEPWRPCLIFAANYLPDFNDNSGSVSRRLVVFSFVEMVQERNTRLKEEIFANELVAILMRCLFAYRRTVDMCRSADFWARIAPACLRDAQNDVKTETNYLSNFLANGDGFYQILFVEGQVTAMLELEKAFGNHCRFVHKDEKIKLGSDHFPIKAAGFSVERVNLCKTCHMLFSKANCGDHYENKNAYRKVMIRNMVIRKR